MADKSIPVLEKGIEIIEDLDETLRIAKALANVLCFTTTLEDMDRDTVPALRIDLYTRLEEAQAQAKALGDFVLAGAK